MRIFELTACCRIQNEEFSKVAVVTTRRKGFGLRSEGGIAECVSLFSLVYCADFWSRGSLVCEYTGEVVNGQQAEKRLRKYMKKRNKHIYMMELQKGEVSCTLISPLTCNAMC